MTGNSSIPISFDCMGARIEVEVTSDLSKKKHGEWDRSTQRISIHADDPLNVQIQTFWHEAVHAILEICCYPDLSGDEDFVERIAQCLHQLERTRVDA